MISQFTMLFAVLGVALVIYLSGHIDISGMEKDARKYWQKENK